MSDEQARFAEWAIVDVMGHQRYIGLVTEQVVAGQGFVRVDIPKTDKQPAWTKLIGTGSIYAITPVSEEVAKAMAKHNETAPVKAYELTPRLVRETHSLLVDEREAYDVDDDEHGAF